MLISHNVWWLFVIIAPPKFGAMDPGQCINPCLCLWRFMGLSSVMNGRTLDKEWLVEIRTRLFIPFSFSLPEATSKQLFLLLLVAKDEVFKDL